MKSHLNSKFIHKLNLAYYISLIWLFDKKKSWSHFIFFKWGLGLPPGAPPPDPSMV